MRIAFLAAASSNHTVKIVNKLIENNHHVTLFSLREHEDINEKISALVNIIYIEGKLPFAYYLCANKLKKLLAKGNFDIVNAHYASGYGTLARRAKAYPLMLNIWGSDVYDFPFRNNFNKRVLIENLLYANQLASTSKIMALHTKELLGTYEKEILVTPFGVDINLFKEKNYNEVMLNVVTIGIVKDLEINYGIEYLIYAMRIVIQSCLKETKTLNIKLKIYGDGSDKARLMRLVSELNLQQYVEFKGEWDNEKLPIELNKLDIFAQVSNNESFGVAAVEAMSVGLPLVVTNTPGFREVVVNRETGIIVPIKNPNEIARGLLELIYDKEKRVEMGQKGRKRVEQLYSFDNNIETLVQGYIKTIEGSKNV